MTKEEALQYCFDQIKPTLLEANEYNRLKMYRNRYEKGELGEGAIKKLFDRFEIESHCYYKVKKN